MNRISLLTTPNFVGIFELDLAGVILYFRQNQMSLPKESNNYLVGQNFFEQVVDFENVQDFRRRFKNFISSRNSTENFLFECRSAEGNIPVRVLMLRASEKNDNQSHDFVILDIRKTNN